MKERRKGKRVGRLLPMLAFIRPPLHHIHMQACIVTEQKVLLIPTHPPPCVFFTTSEFIICPLVDSLNQQEDTLTSVRP